LTELQHRILASVAQRQHFKRVRSALDRRSPPSAPWCEACPRGRLGRGRGGDAPGGEPVGRRHRRRHRSEQRYVFLPYLAVDPAGVDGADLETAAAQTGPDMHVCYRNCAFRILQIAVPLPHDRLLCRSNTTHEETRAWPRSPVPPGFFR
jgi:hypothetical protein